MNLANAYETGTGDSNVQFGHVSMNRLTDNFNAGQRAYNGHSRAKGQELTMRQIVHTQTAQVTAVNHDNQLRRFIVYQSVAKILGSGTVFRRVLVRRAPRNVNIRKDNMDNLSGNIGRVLNLYHLDLNLLEPQSGYRTITSRSGHRLERDTLGLAGGLIGQTGRNRKVRLE